MSTNESKNPYTVQEQCILNVCSYIITWYTCMYVQNKQINQSKRLQYIKDIVKFQLFKNF